MFDAGLQTLARFSGRHCTELKLNEIQTESAHKSDLESYVPDYFSDLVYACEMRIDYGDRANQALVDTMQAALRRGDEVGATRADRALRIIAPGGSSVWNRTATEKT